MREKFSVPPVRNASYQPSTCSTGTFTEEYRSRMLTDRQKSSRVECRIQSKYHGATAGLCGCSGGKSLNGRKSIQRVGSAAAVFSLATVS
jgi:hypothetical protein